MLEVDNLFMGVDMNMHICGYAHISANKILGFVNQRLRSLSCSYIKCLMNYLSPVLYASDASSKYIEQIPNERLLSLAFKLPHLTPFNSNKHT